MSLFLDRTKDLFVDGGRLLAGRVCSLAGQFVLTFGLERRGI